MRLTAEQVQERKRLVAAAKEEQARLTRVRDSLVASPRVPVLGALLLEPCGVLTCAPVLGVLLFEPCGVDLCASAVCSPCLPGCSTRALLCWLTWLCWLRFVQALLRHLRVRLGRKGW